MKIITICGSIKFKDEIMKIAENLSLKGNCILTFIYPTRKSIAEYTKDEIEMLGELHNERIKMSDAIYVVNIDNYIGNSTKKEIEYARSLNKEIIYHEKTDLFK